MPPLSSNLPAPVFNDAAEAAAFIAGLASSRLSGPIHYLAETGSTNDEARRLALDGAPSGTIVLAEHQTAGRGRRGRQWLAAPRSSILISVVVRPELNSSAAVFRERSPWLALLAAAAAARAVASFDLPAAKTEWPNDILIGDRKCGGILTEVHNPSGGESFAVLGIGLNVLTAPTEFPDEISRAATSLAAELGRPVDRRAVLLALLRELDRALALFAEDDPAALEQAVLERSATIGREFRLRRPQGPAGPEGPEGPEGGEVTGRAVGLDESGRLILKTPDGETHRASTADDLTPL